MFDSRGEGERLPGPDHGLFDGFDATPPPELPAQWEAPDWEERFEAICAADPQRPRPASEVLAEVSAAPVSRSGISELVWLDAATFTDTEIVDAVGAWDRLGNHAEAQKARLIETYRCRIPATEVVSARRLTVAEFAPVLGLGTGRTAERVHVGAELTARFPATLAAVEAGEVSWEKAAYLVNATGFLPDTAAGKVEAAVLPGMGRRTLSAYRAGVLRAIDRIDPDAAAHRRALARREIRLARQHLGDGLGSVYATMTSEDADVVWTAADAAARRAKAAGDYRRLDILRVGYLADSARAFLTGQTFTGITIHTTNPDTDDGRSPDPDDGNGPGDDGGDDDGPQDDGPRDAAADADDGGASGSAVPRRHGRGVRVGIVWDLTSLLGLTGHPGRLADSGATLLAPAIRELITGHGVRLRRLLHDDDTGALLDLTPRTWRHGRRGGRTPYLLDVTVPVWLHRAVLTGDVTGLTTDQRHLLDQVTGAVEALDPATRTLLSTLLGFPVTAQTLDDHPAADTPTPALAEFTGRYAGNPANPAAGPSPVAACDLDHTIARRHGGQTVRGNLAPLTRRWHILKTHGGWTVTRLPTGGWEWTSPTGHHHTVEPHDYRLGP